MTWQTIKNRLQKPLAKLFFIAVASILLFVNFCFFSLSGNKGAFVGSNKFVYFQEDSEALVFGKIIADMDDVPTDKSVGLYYVRDKDTKLIGSNDLKNNLSNQEYRSGVKLSAYDSQVGLQGYVFSFLHNKLHIPVSYLRIACALLLVLVIMGILILVRKKYGFLLCFVSYLCILLSPWVCAFAKNLYWVEFTWFLPILFSLILCKKQRLIISSVLLLLAVTIKCLCGFEYISVIFAMVALFPILDLLKSKSDPKSKKILRVTLSVLSCGLGFVIAILIQGAITGQGNIPNGLKLFYEDIVAKRVAGGFSGIEDERLQASLQASPFDVLSSYFDWNSDIITGIPGSLFRLITFTSALLVILGVILGRKKSQLKLVAFILVFFANASWFILASPHSYIHSHMNYVLWYFGFVQFSFYIIADAIVFILRSLGLPRSKKLSIKHEVPDYEIEIIKKKSSDYCVCIPVINEGDRILKELKRAQKANIQKSVDIVICDGGSKDGSIEKAKKLGISAILTKTGAGKQGAQLRTGFDYAIKQGYLGVVTIDGNNKDSIEDVPRFVKKLQKGYDFVQGSRFIKGGKAINTPFYRAIAVRLLHAPLISLTAGKKYTDTTNAFRAYSMHYLKHKQVQPFRDIFSGYELLAFLSVRADQLGMKTCEIPVTRAYPAKGKTPTKISPIRGNTILFSVLLKNALGFYDPIREGDK